jgi:hypothetical protein
MHKIKIPVLILFLIYIPVEDRYGVWGKSWSRQNCLPQVGFCCCATSIAASGYTLSAGRNKLFLLRDKCTGKEAAAQQTGKQNRFQKISLIEN